jgi:hypothetical protein
MENKAKENFFLFTLVNISEDSGLNAEYNNKLFVSYEKARQYMEKCIEEEKRIQETENDCSVMLERIDDNKVNLWLNADCSEGVMYGISKVSPL